MPVTYHLFLLVLSGLIKLAVLSITGVTYMDHFDFEERYEDVTECDPMHWYPLHMPAYCMQMYEDLIRNSLFYPKPFRVAKQRPEPTNREIYSTEEYSFDPTMVYFQNPPPNPYMAPFQKIFKMLEKDVKKEPSAPKITVLPGLGPVALYKQPVSKKSEQYIKKISGVYRNANIDYSRLFPESNTEDTKKNIHIIIKDDKRNSSISEGKVDLQTLKDMFS